MTTLEFVDNKNVEYELCIENGIIRIFGYKIPGWSIISRTFDDKIYWREVDKDVFPKELISFCDRAIRNLILI